MMERIFRTDFEFIEKQVSTGPNNPISAYHFTKYYYNFNRRYSMPKTANIDAWNKWRFALISMLKKILHINYWGEIPTPKVLILKETKCYNYIKKKIAYKTLTDNWVSAYLLIPEKINKPLPAVLCPHGHFEGGKLSVVDPTFSAGMAYGHEFAKRGFIVLAPDNAGMGERDVPASEVYGEKKGGCELLFRRLNHMGLDLTGLRVFELMVAVNILSDLKEVDNKRIGCAGLSLGCWLSQLLTAIDSRIKAVILSGFFTTFVQTVWIGHCVCHHPYKIGEYCDMPDISALIAPRPQFIESGKQDNYYPFEPAYSLVKNAYELLNAKKNLQLELYDGGHEFRGVESIPWMVKQLKLS